jgi:hypothetical protein
MSDVQAPTVEEMFVQLASGVSCTRETLTLEGISPSTLYFSDRPERVVGHLSNRQFVDDWTLGPDSFASDPPNAVLTFSGSDEAMDDVVITLSAPRLDEEKLTYSIAVLAGTLPSNAGACSLFIDPIGRPLSPLSICGVRRRERRRMRRQMI